mmetsp:Transcript_2962/g.7742  ORF Transcript_2962/g.7742 Transcript_2962/m.7742 type:complete len:255 (-) Transcript_2962:2167-2931(-)
MRCLGASVPEGSTPARWGGPPIVAAKRLHVHCRRHSPTLGGLGVLGGRGWLRLISAILMLSSHVCLVLQVALHFGVQVEQLRGLQGDFILGVNLLGSCQVQLLQAQASQQSLWQLPWSSAFQHKAHVYGQGLGCATDHGSDVGGHVVGRHIDVHLNVLGGDMVGGLQGLAQNHRGGAHRLFDEPTAVGDVGDELEHLVARLIGAMHKLVQHKIKWLPPMVVLHWMLGGVCQNGVWVLLCGKCGHDVQQWIAWDD